MDLYRGEFLAQFFLEDSEVFEEWAMLKREWFHLHAVETLAILANYYERRGEYRTARELIRRQVSLEPWREESHRQLMRLLAAEGQRSAALRQYKLCRESLLNELGVEPTAETVALFEAIRTAGVANQRAVGHATFPGAVSPLSLSLAPVHKLPLSPTSFVGRKAELAELADYLASPKCRLVTLVGPGGIGKSRLALEVARQQQGLFAHGIAFVSLAAISDPALLVTALADALNITMGAQSVERKLLDYLREKTMLLVLDNFEHLVPAVDLLAKILHQAPGIVMLVTSRERLNLREEWVYPVSGLACPDATMPLGTASDAVALFMQRAVQAGVVQPATATPFKYPDGWSEATVSAIAHICQLVEGMPLALELAAALMPWRACGEIAADIARNLDVLTSRLRDVPDRQRSIRATFERSWQLLNAPEQAAFRQLAVFRGGFTAEAAETVLETNLVTLQRFVDKSLIYCEPTGRYRMHPLLRQYAAEKSAAFPQEQDAALYRHARYYANFLDQQVPLFRGANQVQVLQAVAAEVDNVRQAWSWARGTLAFGSEPARAFEVVARAMEGLYLFWVIKGWYQEGIALFADMIAAVTALDVAKHDPDWQLLLGKLLARQGKCSEFVNVDRAYDWLERGLHILRQCEAHRETALPLHSLGYVAHMRGDYARARRYFEESREIYQLDENVHGVASTFNMLCLVARREGAFGEARQYCQKSLQMRRELQDWRGMASTLNSLGLVECALGHYAEARAAFEEGVTLCHQLDYKVGLANVLVGLCQATFNQDDIASAEQFAYQALAVYEDIGDRWGRAIVYNNLGYIAMESGDYVRSKDLFHAAITLYREMGIKSGLANTLNNLGQVCYKLEAWDAAQQHFEEALHIARDTGALPILLEIVAWLARLLVREGELPRALEVLAFVRQHPASLDAAKEDARAVFAELAEGQPSARVNELEARGRAQTLETIIAYFVEA